MHATVVRTAHPLTACTVHTIPPLVLKKDSTNPNLNHQIEYLLEITLLDYDLHLKNPVLMCATCVLLGRELCGLPPWTSEPETICTYKEGELKDTLESLRQLYQEALARLLMYNALQTKYGRCRNPTRRFGGKAHIHFPKRTANEPHKRLYLQVGTCTLPKNVFNESHNVC